MLKYIIDLELSSTYRYADIDIYISDVLYEGRLLNEVGLSATLPDIFYGVEDAQNVSFTLSNLDGAITDIYDAEELRGTTVKIHRNEDGTNTETWIGTITQVDINDKAKFNIVVKDQNPLQKKLPYQVLSTDSFSGDVTGFVPERDLGKPFPLIFGQASTDDIMHVPAVYVNEDTTSDYYDYVISHGVVESLVNIYRAGVLVNGSEYTFYDGSQTSPYSGYAYVRFLEEQRDFSGQLYEITSDIKGLEMGGATAERNFIRVIENILSDSVWGLGLTVNATSFDTAAASLIDTSTGVMSDLKCDGGVYTQIKAIDLLEPLLNACRSTLEINSAGEYEITTDIYLTSISASFGSGDRYLENIVSIESRGKVPTTQMYKDYKLKYRHNYLKNEYKHSSTRNVYTFGKDREVSHNFIREYATADRVVSYKDARATNTDEKLSITVGLEGGDLQVYALISVTIPRMNILDKTYQVDAIQKGVSTTSLNLSEYSQSIYVYTVGDLPSNETPEVVADQGWPTSIGTVDLPADNATVGATLGTDVSGGSTSNNYINNSGYMTNITADNITTGTLDADVITVTNLNATEINTGVLKSLSYQTSGSATVSAITSPTADIELYDATDFVDGSSTGWIIGITNDRDPFAWTGKTGNALTGVTGAANNLVNSLVIPRVKCMYISESTNELRFHGDRGDGTIEELIAIGIDTSGYTSLINAGNSNWNGNSILATNNNASADTIYCTNENTGNGSAFWGYAYGTGYGMRGYSTTGIALRGSCGNSGDGMIVLDPDDGSGAPTHTALAGTLWMTSACQMYVNTNGSTTWKLFTRAA